MIVDENLDIEGESAVGVSAEVLRECLLVSQSDSVHLQVSVCLVEPGRWSSPTLCSKGASAGCAG